MSNFHLYVFCLISGITFISIILALKRKSHFTHMSGMIVSMFLGMTVGLTAGVTFGVVYQGNLFLSTILGMVFGILSGTFCGICFGLLSSLEGLMSGLMGGMMGAMLGEMVPVEEAHVFIKIFSLLSTSTIFLLIILSTSKKDTINSTDWLLKPISTALLIGCVLFFGNSLHIEEVVSETIPRHHQQDIHNTTETPKEIKKIVIETLGMSYSPEEVIVERNKPITLALKNSDQIEHDIEIKGTSFNIMSKSTHQHDVKENIIHLHAEPLTTSNVTFTINEVGVYEFYCTIPGHKENGMIGQFVVN